MNVVVSDEAEADLERIADYIAEDNPARALSFVRELGARCGEIAHMPRGFPLVPPYEQKGIRRRVHGSYLIFYRINGGVIEILHILHGALHFEPLLFPEG